MQRIFAKQANSAYPCCTVFENPTLILVPIIDAYVKNEIISPIKKKLQTHKAVISFKVMYILLSNWTCQRVETSSEITKRP